MMLSILFILMAKRITIIETEMRLTICILCLRRD